MHTGLPSLAIVGTKSLMSTRRPVTLVMMRRQPLGRCDSTGLRTTCGKEGEGAREVRCVR
jgi:hypothetical protein